ncbi:MAG: hypothetical protein ACJ790_08165 [Myxococcaceae bacterium]
MKTLLAAVALMVLASSCRTTISPIKRPKDPEVYVVSNDCTVRYYDTTEDLPEGSKSMGRITVPIAENEDETYLALRKKICDAGGNALTSLTWGKSSTETTAQRTELQADAWVLP